LWFRMVVGNFQAVGLICLCITAVVFVLADGKENVALMQQSWLLKAVVVELRITALSRQRSHTHRLMNLLLDDSVRLQPSKRKCTYSNSNLLIIFCFCSLV
jgi:hypothetical protein